MRNRVALVVSLGLLSPVVTVAVLPPSSASAAPITLTEVGSTPWVSSLAGPNMANTRDQMFSSPAVADVTGDGKPEVIVGNINTAARVFNFTTGKIHVLDPGGVDPVTGKSEIHAAPVIGDINRDGVNDVILTTTGGQLAAFSVKNDSVSTIFNHYAVPSFNGSVSGLFGTPALGYFDDDTALDLVTSSWGQLLDIWSGPTAERLPERQHNLRDSLWSSPVVGDITGDGSQSIVVGADCEGGHPMQPCYPTGGGYVWAFDQAGQPRWAHFISGAVVWSTPALVDLNLDGALDVVVGTGLYFMTPAANRIYAIDGKTGARLWSAATAGPTMGSPAVAVVNGEPRIWVVSGGGKLLSYNRSGGLLWETCVSDQLCNASLGTFGGVSIADINNDGTLDAVTHAEGSLRVHNAITGVQQASAKSSYSTGPNAKTMFAGYATPTIASVNGKTWIVMPSIGDANRNGRADGGDELVVAVYTTGTSLGNAPWPTFKQNMARTGGPLPSVPTNPPRRPFGGLKTTIKARPNSSAFVAITAVDTRTGGYLQSLPCAAPPGSSSNVNADGGGQIRAGLGVVPFGSDGGSCIYNHMTTHIVADLQGYIAPAAIDDIADSRILDTRNGPRPAAGSSTVIRGRPNTSAVISLIATETAGPTYLQVLSCSSSAGQTSNLNADSWNQTRSGLAIVRFASDGTACIYTHGAAHIVVDVQAYLTNSAFDDVADVRLLDTRQTALPEARTKIVINGRPNSSGFISIIAADSWEASYVQALPCAAQPGATSNLNVDGPYATISAAAIVRFDANGQACLYTHGRSHLIADLQGYLADWAFEDVTDVRLVDTRERS
jgi:hypothetical protein